MEENAKASPPPQEHKKTHTPKISKIRVLFKFFNMMDGNKAPSMRRTIYHSGDMVSIIMVQKHIRNWVKNTRDKMRNKLGFWGGFKFIGFI